MRSGFADLDAGEIDEFELDELLAAYGSASEFLGDNLPAITLVGVTRLAFPELKVEIEATAAK